MLVFLSEYSALKTTTSWLEILQKLTLRNQMRA